MMVLVIQTYFALGNGYPMIIEYSEPPVGVALFFEGRPIEILVQYLSWGDAHPPVWYS